MNAWDEIKKKTKATAMIVALSGLSAAQAQENASFVSETDDIRSEMASDAKRADIIRDNPETYLEIKNDIGKKITAQFKAPVSDVNKQITVDKTAVGPFPGFVVVDEMDTDFKKYRSNFKSPSSVIARDVREINTNEDLMQYDDMAHYNPSDGKIHQPKWIVSDELRDKLLALHPSWASKLVLGDTPADIATFYHEKTHFFHDQRGQTDNTERQFQTPDMMVEKNYVTEKVAYTVQCLTLAHIWKNCKDAGMETIEIAEKNSPFQKFSVNSPNFRRKS